MEQAKTQPPKLGLYLSTKEVKGLRIIVEEVTEFEEEDDEGDDFFLVSIVSEEGSIDMGIMGDELDSNQWHALVNQYGLTHSQN